jgi:hypothetical protein
VYRRCGTASALIGGTSEAKAHICLSGRRFCANHAIECTISPAVRTANAHESSFFAYLILGNQPIEVDATGYLQISVNSASNWNGSDIING